MQLVLTLNRVCFQKGLDSAIVDCGNAVSWNSREDNVRVHLEICLFFPLNRYSTEMFSLMLLVSGTILQKEQKNCRINTTGWDHLK